MTDKIPISLIIDDGAPLIHPLYYVPWTAKDADGRPVTSDGRPFVRSIPVSFLEKFCGVTEKHAARGNFSVVPMPMAKGDILNGIEGYETGEVKKWLDIVKKRLAPSFDFCPEMLTHSYAVDLETGGLTGLDEETWASTKSRAELTPYIARALEILKEAGIDATGVTSPWSFGIHVEEEYAAAAAEAQELVHGRELSWYFLHTREDEPGVKPWFAIKEENRALVHIPATIGDKLWQTINCSRNDAEYINQIADSYITEDGLGGAIPKRLADGCWLILLTHWQSLFSNGLETGLTVLDTALSRVNGLLGDKLEWMSSLEMARAI